MTWCGNTTRVCKRDAKIMINEALRHQHVLFYLEPLKYLEHLRSENYV